MVSLPLIRATVIISLWRCFYFYFRIKYDLNGYQLVVSHLERKDSLYETYQAKK